MKKCKVEHQLLDLEKENEVIVGTGLLPDGVIGQVAIHDPFPTGKITTDVFKLLGADSINNHRPDSDVKAGQKNLDELIKKYPDQAYLATIAELRFIEMQARIPPIMDVIVQEPEGAIAVDQYRRIVGAVIKASDVDFYTVDAGGYSHMTSSGTIALITPENWGKGVMNVVQEKVDKFVKPFKETQEVLTILRNRT